MSLESSQEIGDNFLGRKHKLEEEADDKFLDGASDHGPEEEEEGTFFLIRKHLPKASLKKIDSKHQDENIEIPANQDQTFDLLLKEEEPPIISSHKIKCPYCESLHLEDSLIAHCIECIMKNGSQHEVIKKKEICSECKEEVEDLKIHNENCIMKYVKQCPNCDDHVGIYDYDLHLKRCLKYNPKTKIEEKKSVEERSKPVVIESKKETPKQFVPSTQEMLKKCVHCGDLFGIYDVTDHESRCLDIRKLIEQDEKVAISTSRKYLETELLNDLQLEAVCYVEKVSERNSIDAYPILLKKFGDLGYKERDLEVTLRYIRLEAPLIVHFRGELLAKFNSDGYYKNTFEVFGPNPARVTWENSMFNHIYNHASPGERVKYGVLNIFNDPRGVLNCYGYGDSYFILENSKVRLRTTMASMDTSSLSARLATCEHYAHVLVTFTDKELEDLIKVATKKKFCADTKVITNYKEIQIHGSVQFSRDVSTLVLNSRFKKIPGVIKDAEEFCSKFNVNFVWMEE